MTQEEKAKAYDEAIERAKEWFNPEEPDSYTSIVESIFPELKAVKEYEDKKIRKELITHCKNIRCVTEEGAEKIANWITWLEKIGEHLKFCKTIQIGDRVTRNEGGVLVNMSQLDKIAKKRKKEGEQKQDFASQKDIPRYHIGDVLCDKSCTTLNKESQSNFEITDIRNGMYICDKCSFPISRQDEYELVAKRIEQKPAWSEEDDYNVQCLVAKVVSDIQNGNVGRNQELIDWLKSLKERYTWKPSKEQMNALDSTLQYSQVSHNSFEHLNSLFNDLKKLKGE